MARKTGTAVKAKSKTVAKASKGASKSKAKGAIGVIGLGIMGGAFARNLVERGWTVYGYDPAPARSKQATRAGVHVVKSPAEVAAHAPVVLISVAKPDALHAIAAEIVGARLTKKLIVEMGTFNISDKDAAQKVLEAAGHTVLDCPVSGTGSQALVRDIVIYASGDRKAVRKLDPIVADIARGLYYVGAYGNGCRIKYVANLLVAINNVASAEAMVLGMKSGLSAKAVFDLVKAGVGTSRVFELRAPMMVKSRYDKPTMKIDVWQKDMQVIGDYARAIGVSTPLLDAAAPIYTKAVAMGLGADDTAAVCQVLERMAGLKRSGAQ